MISFELPVTVTMTDVFDGIAVGRSTDELGVPRIVGYELPDMAAGCCH